MGQAERDYVLIVDDDPGLRETLAGILKRYGTVPLTMSTGQEALEWAEHEDAAVALIDLRLGDMSGLEVMRGLKQRLPELECILVTGYASQASAIEAVNIGAYSYVQKPYDVSQLVLTIRRALEKRVTLRALRESEERYRSLVESSSDHIFILDRQGRYLGSNGRVWRSESDPPIAGCHLADLHSPDTSALCQQQLERVFATGETVTFEHTVTDPSGEGYHQDTLYPLKRSGEIWAVGGICRDITELKRAEAERARLTEQLLQARKLESVGRLAGGVAHDLNNMLTPILGYSATLSASLDAGDPRRADAEVIFRAAERARDLVRQLLAFASKQIMRMKPVDLNGVIAEVETALRRTVRADIAVETHMALALSTIEGDAEQIKQVILDLAANAQDAMPHGGTLVIETAELVLDKSGAEYQDGTLSGRYVVVSVSDTGTGMDKATLDQIFEPFFTTKEFGKGSGLGLATVYGIVRQHRGHIEVSSEPGQGTTVRAYFPVAQGRARSATASESQDRPETILVVEEQDQVRGLICRVLTQEGYTVLDAPNGAKAIRAAALHSEEIQLLLTDVVTPDMSGSVLYRQLASTRPGLQVIYMSGYTAEALAHYGAVELGAGFIQKPFSPQELTIKVYEALDQGANRTGP